MVELEAAIESEVGVGQASELGQGWVGGAVPGVASWAACWGKVFFFLTQSSGST